MSTERIRRRIEELLADARLAYAGGDHEEAAALAAAVLSLDPDNPEATSLLAGLDQRRQMTLMFCDLVGSTALADGMDPEELGAILREYRTTCSAVIERYGGFVEDCLGDGVLVRFGYPWVHEDDARRAVVSGLEIVRAMAAHDLDLHVRIGVHTGLVVVRPGEVVGAAANEAHRIQSAADPDTVVISDTTYALVRDLFDVEPLGPAALRGVSRPFELFAVVGERPSAPLRASALQTPFTNRTGEQAVVAELWQAAAAGSTDATRALLVTAPAGMGKSRLVWECACRLDSRLLACGCSGYHRTTSLHPFGPLLREICGVDADDDAAQRLAKLRARLAADDSGAAGDTRHDLPVLADALAIPSDAITPPTDIDAAKLRAIALHAAARLIGSTVADGPAMLFVDDLHWADQSTLDLISVLLDEPCPGLLLVLAARPGFVAPWPDDALVRLGLEPLAEDDLGEILRGMQEGSSLEEAQGRELIARCDGVPLFLEELVRSGSAIGGARGAGTSLQAPGSRVPDALRDPLLARLVLPGVDLQLAQIAATIGRDVDRDLLQQASGLADRPFQANLANLVAAGLVYPSAEGRIRFRHDLIREVAYETQLRSACRERHSRIADLLGDGTARRSGDTGELAFHLERAGRIPEAIEALLQAGGIHQSLGAHEEAMTKFTHVLELVDQLPEGAARLMGELTARQLRSFSTIVMRGYSTATTAEDHGRCVELCELMGLTPELLPSLIVSWSYYLSHGDVAEAERVCATMERVPSGPAPAATAMTRSVVRGFQGRLDEAHEIAHGFLADPWGQSGGTPPAGWPLPNDPFTAASAHLVVTAWIRGDPAEAEALYALALRRTARLEFPYGPFGAAYASSQLGIVRRLEGDHAAAAQLGAEMVEIGDRHGFALWTLCGQLQQLVTEVHLGDASALEPLVAGIDEWRRGLAVEVYAPFWMTELARAQHAAGRPDEARASLDEVLAVAARTGSDFYTAEALRVRGVVRCQAGDRGGVEDFDAAVAKARAQGARAFELRALASLDGVRNGRVAAP